MATIKIYLDKRSCSESGLAPLKIAINHKSKTAYIPLNLKILPENWNSVTEKIINHPHKNSYNNIILSRKLEIEKKILEINQTVRVHSLSAIELRDMILKEDNQPEELLFIPYYEKFMQSKVAKQTQLTYYSALKQIKEFGGENLRFVDINRQWLKDFDYFLFQKNISTNSRTLYLSKIKATFNDALDNELINFYPFRRFPMKLAKTRKRSLSLEQLRRILALTPTNKVGIMSLNVFKLTFCLIGINAVDLISDNTKLNGNRIEYFRAKTKHFYSIKIETEIESLYEWFVKNKPYKNYKTLASFEMTVNQTLKTITHLPDISLYWARHTWATMAAELDIPKETIAAALGHSQNSVTDVYIRFDNRKIDAANRKVLDYVFNSTNVSDN